MIIVKLIGGLGNQMFQYALGRRVALERGVPLKLDLSWFESQNKRKFELDQFNITAEIASPEDINQLLPYSRNRLLRGVYNRVEKWIPYQKRFIFREQSFGNFDPHVLKVDGIRYFDGYWQSEKYFRPIEARIRADFTLKQPLSSADQALAAEMCANPHLVSIHIRRGDYVSDYRTIQMHYVCTPDYYNAAMRLINARLKGKAFFYVFSDDPGWCRSGVDYPSEYKIVSNGERSAAHELVVMSKCRHAIISNSSFSWWSAWLGSDSHSIVITPAKWLANTHNSTLDLIPENWIKL